MLGGSSAWETSGQLLRLISLEEERLLRQLSVFSNELSYEPVKYAIHQDGPDKGSEVKRGSVEKPPSDV